jgi:hypothetical protein
MLSSHEMSSLIAETPEASAWIEREKAARSGGQIFDRLRSAVVWVDEPGPNHEAIGGNDPTKLIAEINEKGQPTFLGHEPGTPTGRVVAAKEFVGPRGVRFVAAVVGCYGNEQRLQFSHLGVDPAAPVPPPSALPGLPGDPWLDVQVDPREVNSRWLDALLADPPYRVKRGRLSHNAEDPVQELIRIGFPFMVLVWNPLVKKIAEEAGKDLYAAAHRWLRQLWDKLQELRKPVAVLEAVQDDCEVFFIFRGKDVKRNYAAHSLLSGAAAQAANLIKGIKASGERPTSLVYEFDGEAARWYPSYALLADGRIVKDTPFLIAIEQLPTAISLGLLLEEDEEPTNPDHLLE